MICCEQDWGGAGRDWETDYFEIQEFGSKDSYVFKVGHARMEKRTKITKEHKKNSTLNKIIKVIKTMFIFIQFAQISDFFFGGGVGGLKP